MGRKEENSRKRRSPSVSGEDEYRSKKTHRIRDDKEKRRKKKLKREEDRKDRDKSKKSHKNSKHEEKGRSADKLEEKHGKSKRKKDFEEISNDDYYLKNNEFSTWLKEEKALFFSDLTSDEARKLFSDFVEDWNGQKLQSRYYGGIASAPRCAHNWKFKHDK